MTILDHVSVRTSHEWLVSRPQARDLREATMICAAAVRSLRWADESSRGEGLPEDTVRALDEVMALLEGEKPARSVIAHAPNMAQATPAFVLLEKLVTGMDVLAGVALAGALFVVAAGSLLSLSAFQSSILAYFGAAVGVESLFTGILLRRHRRLLSQGS